MFYKIKLKRLKRKVSFLCLEACGKIFSGWIFMYTYIYGLIKPVIDDPSHASLDFYVCISSAA